LKEIILGTAGHIDHGKTSLIKAATGIDTDRLKEEKLRGITIELGFASMALPSGQHLGIVDVPGHEKFVKNMVAGATGIDIVAMVIAADEGVMPQTREHMEICSLLGIKYGLVVLTKVDMVDEEWQELVTEDVREFAQGTFLENAPIIPVSSATGQGIDEFKQVLDDICKQIPERYSSGIFRLPVDRVFTIKGFGTVITGTLISGKVDVGDTVMIYPSGITSKVRGVQVHNQNIGEAKNGMRTAINFQGLEKASINRGDVVSSSDILIPSYMLDVSLNYLKSNKKPMKNRTRIRLHTGTSEILGIVALLDREELAPGDTAVVQLRLDSPVTVVKDDRFVIRSYSPVHTVGGGRILNPIPRKHKRFKAEIIQGIEHLGEATPSEIISWHARESGYQGVSFKHFRLMTNLPEKPLNNEIQALLSDKVLIQTDKENQVYIHQSGFESAKGHIIDFLTSYHRNNPLKGGMPKEELKSKFPSLLSPKSFNLVINKMVKGAEIVLEEENVRLASHVISLAIDQEDIRKKIVDIYSRDGLTPPYFKDLAESLSVDAARARDVLMLLVSERMIVKAKEDLYFHAAAVEDLKARVVDFLTTHGEMTTPQFKEIAGISRKYLIPLIEYFDSLNVTIRVGDSRKLRGR